MSNGLFRGGIPTDGDVKKLIDTFGVPEVGRSIPYESVASTISTPVKSSRFKTITNRWRSKLASLNNLIVEAFDGAFHVMAPDRRVMHTGDRIRKGFKQFRKAHVIISSTDVSGLSPELRAQADHYKQTTATAIQASRARARISSASPSLPEPVGKV
jgi:hypothetical protein